jgi:hypothetical protein
MTSSSLLAIEIRLFRGNGPPGRPAVIDERLEKYGHVGISLIEATEGEPEIEGFNPAPPPGMPRGEFLERLGVGESFPGQLDKDTWLFARAEATRPKHLMEKHRLDMSTCLEVKRRLGQDRNNSPMSHKKYSFPRRDGCGFAPGTMNCVLYPLSLGIPASLYPYAHGRLSLILERDQFLIIKYECG